MSKLVVDTIEGKTGTTVTIPSGQTLSVAGTLTSTPGATLGGGPTISGSSTVPTGSKISGADAGSLTAPGVFINAVSASKTDAQSNATNNSFTDISGLTVTITPKSTSSKILLLCNISISAGSDATGRAFKVLRGSTAIGVGSDGSRPQVSFFGSPMSSDGNMQGTCSWHYLDSPNSTSALTYKVQSSGFNAGVTTWINRNQNGNGQPYDCIASSNITAIEVAG